MRIRACVWASLALFTGCRTTPPERRGPPAAILARLSPMMVETGVSLGCLGDNNGVPPGTLPVDLLLVPDSTASSSVVRVSFVHTPIRAQEPVLSVSMHEIGQTRVVGASCGAQGVTLRASAARFSAIEIRFTTWAPIRVVVRDSEWRPLAVQLLAESSSRPVEITWRWQRSLTGFAADSEVMERAEAFASLTSTARFY
ncbi:hypothetical protein GPROT1_02016 [Gammaproteobacteria bacterium]|nr:hypothetical protein GPROT1_02016 [Gammaproteobacteria bacterium]